MAQSLGKRQWNDSLEQSQFDIEQSPAMLVKDSSDSATNWQKRSSKIARLDSTEDFGYPQASSTMIQDENNNSSVRDVNQSMEQTVVQIEDNIVDEETDFHDLNGLPGHLISIQLYNFMCHENFYFEFSPRVNVLQGENGSGKSAILSAVMLAFGVRATSTNRVKHLNAFIKKNCKSARIELKIRNYSRDEDLFLAYHPETFGKIIAIERDIKENSSNSFKVRNGETNAVVPKGRDQIDQIAKHFNIRVDNPACVLTQEVSKCFLNSCDPSAKYTFYSRATELETIERLYTSATQTHAKQSQLFMHKKKEVDRKREEHDQAKEDFALVEQAQKNTIEIETLRKELEWALVRDQESVVAKIEKNIRKLEKEMSSLKDDKNDLDQKLTEYRSKIEQINANKAKSVEVANQLQEIFENLRNDTSTRSALTIATRRLEVQKKELDAYVREKNELSKTLDLATSQGDYRNDITQTCEIIKQKTLELSEAKQQREKLPSDQKLDEMKYETEMLFNAKTELAETHQDQGFQLKRLLNSQNDRFAHLGEDMTKLMRAIDAQKIKGSFRAEVYGPLYQYIKVDKPIMYEILEEEFKNSLRKFLVSDINDLRIVKRLIDTIWSGNKQSPATVAFRPLTAPIVPTESARYQEFGSLWDHFTITETAVANYIIDNHSPERVLYIPDTQVAINICGDRQSISKRIPIFHQADNIKHVRTSDGVLIKTDPFRVYSLEPNRYRVMIPSFEKAIEDLRRNITATARNLELKNREYLSKRQVYTSKNQERIKIENRLMELESDLKQQKRRLVYFEEKNSEVCSIDINRLQSEIDDLESKSEVERKKFIELKEIQRKAIVAYDKHQVEVDLAHKTYDDFNDSALLEEKLKKIQTKCLQIKQAIEENENSLGDREYEIEFLKETSLQNEKDKLSNLTAKVQHEVGDRMSKLRETETLRSQIRKRERQQLSIVKYERQAKSIKKRLYEKEQQLNEARKSFYNCGKLMFEMENSIKTRLVALQKAKEYTMKKVNYYFKRILNERNMNGVIDIEEPKIASMNSTTNDDKKLRIFCMPCAGDQTDSSDPMFAQDIRSLSGGERSFSTVAFVVALWNISKVPFRILDEVDVFMDYLTRRASLEVLVSFAQNASHGQFLFLTPLSIPDLEQSPKVKIFQMPPVKRH